MAVKPIPDGYHTITPYLLVPGVPNLIDFLLVDTSDKIDNAIFPRIRLEDRFRDRETLNLILSL